MIGSLPLGFAQPLVLLGLLGLPVLWWLLRLVPPRPRRIDFPPTRLLFEIAPKEETPARTPWWLTLLRLTLAALVIIAAAGPLWNPPIATANRAAPLLLLLDDGWGAAASWDARLRTADEMLARADADNRGVAVLPLSETARDLSLQVAGAARVQIKQIKPKPYTVDRTEALPLIERFLKTAPDVEIVWLSDGVDLGKGGEFIAGLKRIVGSHPLTVVAGGLAVPHALAAADNAAGALTVKVLRAQTGGADTGFVNAIDLKGLSLGEAPFAFRSDASEADAVIDLPVEIRNDVARLEIVGERSAGAVQLLDKRWRRRTVGIVSGSTADRSQPLIGATYYLARALNPFADIRLAEGVAPAEAVKRFLDQHLPMLILADVGNVAEARERLDKWIDNGGVLVRFAGPHLAGATDDDLVPVKLRRGGRILGGSLSWEKPQPLAGFAREGPFAGMPVPNDVTVSRQVLAEPDSRLTDRTWATLADGTPLVTAQRYGKGLLVLFHVTADTRWSDLPLSGTFVDMLRRIVALAGATATADSENTAERRQRPRQPGRAGDPRARRLRRLLDAAADRPPGAGQFQRPRQCRSSARLLRAAGRPGRGQHAGAQRSAGAARFLAAQRPSRRLPPWRAARPARADLPRRVRAADARCAGGDLAVRRYCQHAAAPARDSGAAGGGAAGGADYAPSGAGAARATAPQSAQQQDFAMKATMQTRLAYIVTGDAEVDAVSKAGLQGLTLFLAQRTALEAGEPIGLDPARDELAFFPLIYWPVSANATKPSQTALDRIDTYMKRGGTVLFDTRDAIDTPAQRRNTGPRHGGAALDPVLARHSRARAGAARSRADQNVFPAARLPRPLHQWASSGSRRCRRKTDDDANRPARAGDGVSSIMITSNDLAGAWAMRPDGEPMLPLVPGEPRQREFAFRAGVNIVMYALTGNYKADQVHIPALLERLGQ